MLTSHEPSVKNLSICGQKIQINYLQLIQLLPVIAKSFLIKLSKLPEATNTAAMSHPVSHTNQKASSFNS